MHETLELMLPYDLVVVEEVGQFERIMELWQAAERLPTLVFVGYSASDSCALDSWMWHNVMVKKRELHTMRRCKCQILRKKLELLRTNQPNLPQLREILRGGKSRLRPEQDAEHGGCGPRRRRRPCS